MRFKGDSRSRLPIPLTQHAYSLTEMLVVLAIIGIMAAIVIPQIAFSSKGAGLKGAATELMSTMRTARRMAIAEREYRIVALNLYAIPGEFAIMRPKTAADSSPQLWIVVGEKQRLPDNIAIVSVTDLGWTSLDVTRTDDVDLNGAEDPVLTNTALYNQQPAIYNPELNPTTGKPNPATNSIPNPLFRVIRFYPTGTADEAVIYLWNITEARREIPNPSVNLSAANLSKLGVPPGFLLYNEADQADFFRLRNDELQDDAYYYTLVVSPITGSVAVYDYAWGTGAKVEDPLGSGTYYYEWDRKKDGG